MTMLHCENVVLLCLNSHTVKNGEKSREPFHLWHPVQHNRDKTEMQYLPVAISVATLSSAASMWSMSNACILWAWRTDFILNRSDERHDRKFLKSMCSASYQWIQAARIRDDDWPRRISVAWSSAQKSTKPNTHTYTHTPQCFSSLPTHTQSGMRHLVNAYEVEAGTV